jgi:lactoylglutathione lyase
LKNKKEHSMELFGFRLLVSDFAAAVHFWRDLMKLPLSYQDETLGYAYFDTGKAGLELMRHNDFASAMGEATPVPEPQGRQIVIDFRVDDVDIMYGELIAQGAISVAPPQDRPAWRARTAHIVDPDGHVIELYTSLPA